MPNTSYTDTDTDHIDVDSARLIDLLWQGWITLLDRYDGRDTAVTDPVERLRVLYELHAKGLLLCSVPAPNHHALGCKAIVVAWLRDHGRGAWTAQMIEAAIAADTVALQPANALPV